MAVPCGFVFVARNLINLRIYDALTWLLFGKDSQGNGEKNIDIKPLAANGEVLDHDALTAVEAVLLVNGEEITFRRTYREVWTTKRGSSESTFDGNTSEYYVSGVPCKKNAFQDKVNELVSEDTFRLLTSVNYFASQISWQDRRAVLFEIAGVFDDATILSSEQRFAPLVESLGRLSLDEYRKKLLAEKRGFVGAKTEIPARISECQKTIEDVSCLDFEGAKAESARLQASIAGVTSRILAIEHNSAAEQKTLEIRETKLALSALEHENETYRSGQNTGKADVERLQASLSALLSRMEKEKTEISRISKYVQGIEKDIADSRSRWMEVNAESPDITTTCPTCGQSLPKEQVQKTVDSAAADKQKRLDTILATANFLKETKAQADSKLEAMRDSVGQIESEIKQLNQQISVAEAAVVTVADMDGYAEKKQRLSDKINTLSTELADMMRDSYGVKAELQREKDELQRQLSEQSVIINKESLLDYSRQRIESLREDAQNAASCLESIEKMLFLMDEYVRYKTRFVEDSINSKFRLARFRLFREQANGGIEDRCDVVYEGVPYLCVNNGMKINLGIDIINTLSTAYGVKVPLFVDNAEAVTNLEKCGSQIIRLVVSENDKELRVSYEN